MSDPTFVFVDMETMGLRLDAPIVEVAMVLVDGDLEIYDEWSTVAPFSELEWISQCEGTALKLHSDTGLMAESIARFARAVAGSAEIPTLAQRMAILDALMLQRLVTWGLGPRQTCFVGNSLHMDRAWMRRSMPRTDEYAHYRQIDVSTIRGLAERWFVPDLSKWWRTQGAPGTHHRALDDAKFALQELRLYREHVFGGVTLGQHVAQSQEKSPPITVSDVSKAREEGWVEGFKEMKLTAVEELHRRAAHAGHGSQAPDELKWAAKAIGALSPKGSADLPQSACPCSAPHGCAPEVSKKGTAT
jgi:oligoribonuclease